MLEMRMAEQCTGATSQSAGYWKNGPLNCGTLYPQLPLHVSEEHANQMRWEMNAAQIKRLLQTANRRLSRIDQPAMGYAGWLVTNRLFQDEHDALLKCWETEIRMAGLSGVGRIVVTRGAPSLPEVTVSSRYTEFAGAIRGFLIRWRLTDLVGPMLPSPMKPMLSGSFPISVLQQLVDAGGLFNIPDIFPIPSRDELRGMLLDAMRSSGSDHLAEWHKIIHGSNVAKNQIERFGRIRRLSHFWRLLHLRHGNELRRKIECLQRTFAAYFNVTEATVKSDLRLITQRLGKGWDGSGTPSPLQQAVNLSFARAPGPASDKVLERFHAL